MKSNTTSLFTFASALAVGAAVFLSACSKTDNTSTGTTSPSTTSSTTPSASSMTAAMTDSWDNLRGYSYDQRMELQAKADAMAARLEEQTSKASGETSRQLADARDELRSASAEISNATSETWDATKERIGRAWQKAESAVQGVAE